MATTPKHVVLARKKGAQAGFDQWMDYLTRVTNDGTNGLDGAVDLLTTVRKRGAYSKRSGEFAKPEKALAFYCNKYGIDPDAAPAKPRRAASRKAATATATSASGTDATKEAVAKLIAAGFSVDDALDMVGALNNGDTDDEMGDETDDAPAITPGKPSTKSPDNPFVPSDRIKDEPASNGRLYKLNTLGRLAILDEDGDIIAGGDGAPFTNIEAHEAIAAAL